MENEATPATHGPLAPPSSVLVPKPRSKRHAKCAHHPQWTAQEKKQLCCWACQALLDSSLPRRKKPCVNPWPWARDSLLKLKHALQGLGLTTFKGYKLNASAINDTNKNGEAEVPLARQHEDHETRVIPKEHDAARDDLDLAPQELNQPPVSVGLGDHEAEKVARYLQAMATPIGGGQVATIDHLLDRVKSAYVRLMGSVPGNVPTRADKPDLLVPLVPDIQEEGGNAVEEFVADHMVATAGQGTEDGILPPSDPQRLSPNPMLSDQSHTRVDSIGTDVGPSVGGVGKEDGMEDWANLDLKELLDDFDDNDDDDNNNDDNDDLTDRHWKRGSEEPHDPTTSSTGNRDRYDKLDQPELRIFATTTPAFTGGPARLVSFPD